MHKRTFTGRSPKNDVTPAMEAELLRSEDIDTRVAVLRLGIIAVLSAHNEFVTDGQMLALDKQWREMQSLIHERQTILAGIEELRRKG